MHEHSSPIASQRLAQPSKLKFMEREETLANAVIVKCVERRDEEEESWAIVAHSQRSVHSVFSTYSVTIR